MDQNIQKSKKSVVWDCGSSLYDSVELASFERQLDSAITNSARSLSMPRLSDTSQENPVPKVPKKPFKFSRSLQKLVRSIFGPKHGNTTTASWLKGQKGHFSHEKGFHFFYDGSGALTTIPEECGGATPEIGPTVGKVSSERFTAARVGISCV